MRKFLELEFVHDEVPLGVDASPVDRLRHHGGHGTEGQSAHPNQGLHHHGRRFGEVRGTSLFK